MTRKEKNLAIVSAIARFFLKKNDGLNRALFLIQEWVHKLLKKSKVATVSNLFKEPCRKRFRSL